MRARGLWIIILCLVLALGSTGCHQSRAIARPGVKEVLPQFELVYQKMTTTTVPVALPTWIPLNAYYYTEAGRTFYLDVPVTAEGDFEGFWATVEDYRVDKYRIALNATENCSGAGYCSFGEFGAKKVYGDSPTVAQEYAFLDNPRFRPLLRSPEKGGSVELSQGLKGTFIPYVCGANCDTSKIFWELNGYRYWTGIRMASRDTLIKMANSMIDNQV